MATSPNTVIQALTIFAGVLAFASLVIAALYVRDREQRRSGLLLSIGILFLLGAPMLESPALSMTITGIAAVLVVLSAVLSIRTLRARSD
jgi:hypothetical protein